MQTNLYHLHTLSALHCGTGQSAGVVDLPIARARASQLPLVPGSSLRGVLREFIHGSHPDAEPALFGPRSIAANEDSFAGALAIGDGHLLLLPVRCLAGIVCFVTSPYILRRYRQDRLRAGLDTPAVPQPPNSATALLPTGSVNRSEDQLVLEDSDLATGNHAGADEWAKLIATTIHRDDEEAAADLRSRIAILPDDLMGFLSETATEIRARIAIDPGTGVVQKGALWYEENLPAEAILWGVYALAASDRTGLPPFEQLTTDLDDQLLQLGGKAGVGRGLVRLLTTTETMETPA